MVLRNDGPERLSPPAWCSSRGMQSTKDYVDIPSGTTGWFGPNPLKKDNIIPVDQTNLKIFLTGEPQILGVAQILIGVMKVCLFAIGLCFHLSDFHYWCLPLNMISGYPVWGSLFFFLSGAMSIAAGRKMTLNLIKGSLGMNMLSAITGTIGILMLIAELNIMLETEKKCLILRTFEIVILVLSLLEVSIAISLSVFGCKVTCFVTQVVVIQSTNDQVSSAIDPQEHVYEELEFG
ncbi:membrane-spanning 4-domains subfamily A member 4A-like isoform X2 [Hyaena hyaena]|uniref:membrane-spanning 4-domains subfamily A member 4A-like isoform X2 n=1 Tax=Hyaena hyaena TaxID=95912 RepID=UPI0019220452|nr:membrane-spanning 4-domains subfamily A member 4A-like isoform X2 [Hyaena hyaena]